MLRFTITAHLKGPIPPSDSPMTGKLRRLAGDERSARERHNAHRLHTFVVTGPSRCVSCQCTAVGVQSAGHVVHKGPDAAVGA